MIPRASQEQYRRQAAIAATTAASAAKLWRRLGSEFSAQWPELRPRLVEVVESGRAASVRAAVPYTAAVLAETRQVAPAVGRLNPSRFLRSTPDGRDLVTLLDGSIVEVKSAVKAGAPVREALGSGGSRLTRDVLTVLADTRRQVYHVDIMQRPTLTGYARMLNAPSCSRCVVLAGKWFRWNQGFQRHPRCDCIHVPASESVASDIRVDPREYFESLSADAQDKAFGVNDARAIRDGADVGHVVNIRQRGLTVAKPSRRRGTHMTVDDIYRLTSSREDAIRLLTLEGYVNPAFGR